MQRACIALALVLCHCTFDTAGVQHDLAAALDHATLETVTADVVLDGPDGKDGGADLTPALDRLPDHSHADMPWNDGPGPDSPLSDGPLPDAPVPDAPVPDSPVPDSPVPDSPVPDSLVPDSPVPDSPVPDAKWTCTQLYGSAPSFVLCNQSPTSCRFYSDTSSETCTSLCAKGGGTCTGACEESGSGYCNCDYQDVCSSPAIDQICTCTHP